MVASCTLKSSAFNWPICIAVSVLVNFVIAGMISKDTTPELRSVPPVLKLNLMSLQSRPSSQKNTHEKTLTTQDASKLQEPIKQQQDVPRPVLETTVPQTKQARISPLTKVQGASVTDKPDRFVNDNQKTKGMSSKNQTVPTTSSDQNSTHASNVLIREVRYRHQTLPIYPIRALELGQEGTVLVQAEVLPNGRTRALKIAESSGYRLLDHAAITAVKKWEFEPTYTNGNVITSWVQVPVHFVIKQ